MKIFIKSIQCAFEKLYVNILGLKHIPGSSDKLIYIDIKKYSGKTIILDGIHIHSGDTIAEMHIDNLNVHKIDNSLKTIIRNYQKEMNCLVNACDNIDEFKNIKAVYGISVLHPLLKYIGFTCFSIKNPVYRSYLRWWENILRQSFAAGPTKKNAKKNNPMVCWVSIDKLRQKSRGK